MATAIKPDNSPLFDEDGFFPHGAAWDEDLARQIALADGLGELDECQMSIVRQLRASYVHLDAVPSLAHVCHLCGLEGDCLSARFRDAREAWRIAGLPNPGEEAKTYL